MKKICYMLVLWAVAITASWAQANEKELTVAMLKEADAMGRALVAKDYKGFAKYTHPVVLQSYGGVDRMAELIQQSFDPLEAEGIRLVEISFSEPSKFVTSGEELQCTVTQVIDMEVHGEERLSTTTMIAVSPDKGKTWHFLDTAGMGYSRLKFMIPNLSPELVIPEPAPHQQQRPQ